jgi:hypothetical protein
MDLIQAIKNDLESTKLTLSSTSRQLRETQSSKALIEAEVEELSHYCDKLNTNMEVFL